MPESIHPKESYIYTGADNNIHIAVPKPGGGQQSHTLCANTGNFDERYQQAIDLRNKLCIKLWGAPFDQLYSKTLDDIDGHIVDAAYELYWLDSDYQQFSVPTAILLAGMSARNSHYTAYDTAEVFGIDGYETIKGLHKHLSRRGLLEVVGNIKRYSKRKPANLYAVSESGKELVTRLRSVNAQLEGRPLADYSRERYAKLYDTLKNDYRYLTCASWAVLKIIEHGVHTDAEIARWLDRHTSTVCRIIANAQSNGLVKSWFSDPKSSSNLNKLSLTDKGKLLLNLLATI